MAKGDDSNPTSPTGVRSGATSPASPVKSSDLAVKNVVPERQEPVADPRMADPVFATLADPTLPPLAKLNRAWLQMQSPGRLFFYWSVKPDPYELLRKTFAGSADGYTLVAKLIDVESGREEIHAVGTSGDWWFDADPGRTYRAEIGFASASRPYVRVVFSNTVETPRSTPSPRAASESEWAISAELFSRVLEKAGYGADAAAVALAGDDGKLADEKTALAFAEMMGETRSEAFDPEELRYAMLLLAAGFGIEEIRDRISRALYLFLLANQELLSAEKALAALRNHFDIVEEELIEEWETGSAVHGASLINMPARLRRLRARLVPHGHSSPSRPGPSGAR